MQTRKQVRVNEVKYQKEMFLAIKESLKLQNELENKQKQEQSTLPSKVKRATRIELDEDGKPVPKKK